jgi:alpha-1,3-glucosyltransferase
VILAPTPRRHLLESSASQHWLNTPLALSPMSSRPVSPQSQVGDSSAPSATSTTFPSTNIRRRFSSTHQRSISAMLLENDDRSKNPNQTTLTAKHRAKAHEPEETATGRRWIRWMHKCGQRQWVVPGTIAVATLIKLAIGLGSYSGVSTADQVFAAKLKYLLKDMVHPLCSATTKLSGIGWS